jgi:hypothetical protein
MKNQPTTQSYEVISLDPEFYGMKMGTVTFPKHTDCANYGGVCFYDPETDTFRGDTEVNGFLMKKVS